MLVPWLFARQGKGWQGERRNVWALPREAKLGKIGASLYLLTHYWGRPALADEFVRIKLCQSKTWPKVHAAAAPRRDG